MSDQSLARASDSNTDQGIILDPLYSYILRSQSSVRNKVIDCRDFFRINDDNQTIVWDKTIYGQLLNYFKLYLEDNPYSACPNVSSIIDMELNVDSIKTESFENFINQERIQEFKRQFTPELIRLIQETDFEYGIDTQVDKFLRERMNENSICTKSWLNEVFLENYNKPPVISGILRVISRFEYSDIYPEGQTMALAALTHGNPEVQECGVRAFEQWNDSQAIEILEKTKGNRPWIQEYIDAVVGDLKKEYYGVLSEKNR